jgi:hypothetical protein
MTPLEKLDTLIKAFEATQEKYSKYGARDSEPDGIFQRLLDAALDGKSPAVPRTGAAWELYASSMDCDEAAAALEKAARAVVDVIEDIPIRHSAALRQKIEKYCWRIY